MLRFQTLGTIDLRTEDGERLDQLLGQPKRLALLAVLAAHQPSGPVRREKLVSLLWPDSAPSSARTALSTTLSRLRNSLGGEVLRGRGEESIAISEDHLRSDVAAFQRALEEVRYREAVELYGGAFLEGFRPPDARPFEEWMARRRDEYGQEAYRAAMEAAEEARGGGEPGAAETCLRKARQIEPLRGEPVRALMELFAGRGDRASALRVFDDFRDLLEERVGLSPSEDLTQLAEELRSDAYEPGGGTTGVPAEPGSERREPHRSGAGAPAAGEAAGEDPGEESVRRLEAIPAGLLLIGALAVTALAGWLVFATRGPEGAATGKGKGSTARAGAVAVLPFHISGAASETWRDGMVTLLSTSLDGAGGLRAVADRTVLAAWERSGSAGEGESSQEALSVARRAGARYAVLGSAVAVGGEVRFSASVHDTRSGERLGRARARGSPDSVPALTERLARRLVGILAEGTGRGSSTGDLASVTTRSLPALKAYLEGERHYRRGDFGAAIEDYRRSSTGDTAFALAYWRLASSLSWAGRRGVLRNLQRAYDRRERLPERERRILRASWLLRNRERALAAVDSARRLSGMYPDDPAVWYQLGDGVLHTGVPRGWGEAETAFRNATRLDPGFAPYYIHHLQSAISFRHDSTLAAVRLAETPRPDAARPWFPLAVDLAFGDSVRRRSALARIERIPAPDSLPLGHLRESLLHPEDGDQHEAVLRTYPDDSTASEALVHNLLRRGRIDEAVRELETAPDSPVVACGLAQAMSLGYPVPDSVLRLHLSPSGVGSSLDESQSLTRRLCLGIYLAEREMDRELEELLSRLRAAADREGTSRREERIRDALDVLRGYRAWMAGDLERATQLLGQSVFTARPHFLASSWRGLWRGDLYRSKGRLEKAEAWYMTAWFHPIAHRRLGTIYRRMGEPEKAAAAYRRFIDAWDGADPALQSRVEGARERLKISSGMIR